MRSAASSSVSVSYHILKGLMQSCGISESVKSWRQSFPGTLRSVGQFSSLFCFRGSEPKGSRSLSVVSSTSPLFHSFSMLSPSLLFQPQSITPYCPCMSGHYTWVVSACFYQLRKIRQVRRVVGQDITQQLVSAFVFSRLDYCNSLLSGLPRSTIQSLQCVMNAAARVVMALSTRDRVKLALKQLHWLPVEQWISYTSYVFWCTTFIPVRLHNIWVTVSQRSLHPGTGTDSDRVTRLTTYCREHAPSLANMVSTTPVRPPGTVCHLTYLTLLTLTYSRNDLKLFCLIVRTDLLLLLYGAPGRFVERRLTNLSLYLYLYEQCQFDVLLNCTCRPSVKYFNWITE